jgi:hypothetical protein
MDEGFATAESAVRQVWSGSKSQGIRVRNDGLGDND